MTRGQTDGQTDGRTDTTLAVRGGGILLPTALIYCILGHVYNYGSLHNLIYISSGCRSVIDLS